MTSSIHSEFNWPLIVLIGLIILWRKYKVSSFFCQDTMQDENPNDQIILKDSNMTWNEFCTKMSYQLNRDFTVSLTKTFYETNGTQLKIGDNYFHGSKITVRQILSKYAGLCYTILSDIELNSIKQFIRISISVRKTRLEIYFTFYQS